jgi:mRNA interferase YafQ
MRKIKLTSKFDKDLKKIGLSAELIDVLHHLIHGIPLPAVYLDHQLKGELKDYRDCHVKNDLVLLYRVIENDESVELYRLNTHSELFKN